MVSFAGAGDVYLPIWSAEWPIDMDRIKRAKQLLPLSPEFIVLPRRVDGPGQYPRFLAVGGNPPFLGDYALIGPRSDSPGLKAAVAWTLGLTEDRRATTLLTGLRHVFGPEVREISEEELASERRLVSYLTGSD